MQQPEGAAGAKQAEQAEGGREWPSTHVGALARAMPESRPNTSQIVPQLPKVHLS